MAENKLQNLEQQTKKPTPLGHLPLRQRALAETISVTTIAAPIL